MTFEGSRLRTVSLSSAASVSSASASMPLGALESSGARSAVWTDVGIERVGRGEGDLLKKLRTRSRVREDCGFKLIVAL